MINITSKALEALKNGAAQTVKIGVAPLTGEPYEIGGADITLGGLTIERLCVNGDEFEVGSCCASTAKLTLDNSNGKFDGKFFGGAVLNIKVGVEYDDTVEWLPMGVYTVDEQPRSASSITLEAYDNMVKLDITASELTLPSSRRELVRWCIQQAGLICDDYSMFSDSAESGGYISGTPEFSESPTLRQLIMYCCELDGVCGYTDGDGHIVFKDYGGNEAFNIDESLRYETDSLEETDTVIDGVRIISEEISYPAEVTGDYIIEIESNPLFDVCNNKLKCAESLNTKIAGRTYRGFSCKTLSLPFLQPLDTVNFVKDSVSYSSFITNTSYTINDKMSLEAKCVTQTQKGYASLGSLTQSQKSVIEKTKHELKKDLENREQSLIDLNDMVNASLGFYTTTVKDPVTGAVKQYMHDKPSLEESGTIYTKTEQGFAWTNSGWNDGAPVWNYGIDKNGNAVLNAISANKISGEYIEGDLISGEELRIKFMKNDEAVSIDQGFSDIEQQLTATGGQLVSQIQQVSDSLEDEVQGVKAGISSLTQTVDGLSFDVSSTGAGNLIKNSVGYFGLDQWDHYGLVSVIPENFTNSSASKSGFALVMGSHMSQTISTWSGKTYTISFLLLQDPNSVSHFTITGGASDVQMTFSGKLYDRELQQVSVVSTGNLTIKFQVEMGGAAISDLMCNIGPLAAPWTNADNEMFDTNFSFNSDGFTIKQSEYDGYMNLRASEIANYYQGEKVFFLNKDETDIAKLTAHDRIDMEPFKIIPFTGPEKRGWAFVKLGD